MKCNSTENNSNNDKDNKYNNNDNNESIEDYIKNLDTYLANLEKIGVVLLLFGYSNYIFAANLDILEALEENNTGIKPEDVFVYGQRFVFLGYIILYIVAVKRINEREVRNTYNDEDYDLNPYFEVSFSYFISVIANLIRLDAFIRIER